MTSAYFISDLHIGANEDDEENRKQSHALKFLDRISSDATHLFIVGDFFDFWFEYKYVVPKKYFEFLFRLKKLTEKGTKVHYMAGNHDFAIDNFFPGFMNISVSLDEHIAELSGKKFYLFHGDGIAKKDAAYRILKRILRNRTNQRIFRFIHPDIGIPLARFVSGSSRKYTNQMNHLRDEGDYIEFAETKFNEGFDYVLMGHRHNPLKHMNGSKIYINLGDWITLFSYAHFNGTELDLKYFPMD